MREISKTWAAESRNKADNRPFCCVAHPDIDDCADAVCLFDSTCVDGVNGYTCVCQDGYTGLHCHQGKDVTVISFRTGPCAGGWTIECLHASAADFHTINVAVNFSLILALPPRASLHTHILMIIITTSMFSFYALKRYQRV